MDLPFYSLYPYHRHGVSMSGHCTHCGQGIIVASDSYMNIRCDQCGRYMAIMPRSREFDFKAIRSVFAQLRLWTKKCFFNLLVPRSEDRDSVARESA